MSVRPMLRVAVSLFMLAVPGAAALQAETIEYAWSGQLIPTASEDPWSLGPGGAAFDLRVYAISDVSDTAPLDLKFSIFAASAAELKVGGQDIDYLGNGVLDFTDNTAPPEYDSVVFTGRFSSNGVPLLIGSAVSFSLADVLTFTQDDAPLPIFPSTSDVLQSIAIEFPYKAVVAAQTLVTVRVVSEPGTCVPFALGLAFLRRRRSFRLALRRGPS